MLRRAAFALVLAAAAPAGAVLPEYRLVMTAEEGPLDPAVEARYTPALKACQAKAETTDDNARCFADEAKRQDAALNRVWKAVWTPLPAPRKAELLASQRKWIAARDPFCTKVADEFTGGTIHSLIWFNCNAEQSIRRTLWLERLGR